MGKNITLKQLNKSSTYDELYPAGAIDYTMLTETTSAAYGVENGSVKDALTGLYQYIHSSDVVKIKVVDASNNPLPNITANGIIGSPQSGADGVIKGVADSNSVTLVSPYVDTIKTKTVDVSKYKNTTRTLIVTMDSVADGAIVRYTSSQNVMFSSRVENIDVCCVGGGGAGGVGINNSHGEGFGGGGGGIVNLISFVVNTNVSYQINVGSGGTYSGSVASNSGGSSSFSNYVIANGGGGVTIDYSTGSGAMSPGKAGATGCGDGSSGSTIAGSNTTVSEFNDGIIFYSGGGGGASGVTYPSSSNPKNGGKPNGANGAWFNRNTNKMENATVAGIGGGGGGGIDATYNQYGRYGADGSSGGPGLVSIRVHLKS